MVRASQNNLKKYPFVDREGYIQKFKENVYNIGQKEYTVLVYYGIAGVGKTSLRKELPRCLEIHNSQSQYRKTIWLQ